jgi:hypothetical protein
VRKRNRQHSQEASPQHTPGPWNYERIGSGEFLITDPGPPLPGFKVSAVGKMGLNEADARLAAAAPDLLAQLKNAEEVIRHIRLRTTWEDAVLAWVQAAIAKARGRNQ